MRWQWRRWQLILKQFVLVRREQHLLVQWKQFLILIEQRQHVFLIEREQYIVFFE